MTREDGTTYKLYWAKSNLGANGLCSNPEDYGEYYAWGETSSKSYYEWISYRWSDNNGPTKYTAGSNKIDDLAELQRGEKDGETIDDAARAILKGKWRMPTHAECKTLIDSCSWTWVDNYNDSGIGGCLVTSNIDGFEDASIFLPACGYMYGSMKDDQGITGYYWTSSLYATTGYEARDFSFYTSDGGAFPKTYHTGRYFGFAIRPVIEK